MKLVFYISACPQAETGKGSAAIKLFLRTRNIENMALQDLTLSFPFNLILFYLYLFFIIACVTMHNYYGIFFS